MSEHWKSTPKYWCKHCSIYVKDTPFEKRQHESTGKHQGNLKRFLNGIQKDHARAEREKDKVKAEVERLSRISGGSTSATSASPSSAAQPRSTKAIPTVLSATDQKKQWAQLAEMGIAVPEQARLDMAIPGGWQTLSRKTVDERDDEPQEDKLILGVRKRKFEGQDEEQEAGVVVAKRGWGSATKTYPGAEPPAEDLSSLLKGSLFQKKMNRGTQALPGDESKERADEIQAIQKMNDENEPNTKSTSLLAPKLEQLESNTNVDSPLQTFAAGEDIKPLNRAEQQEMTIPVFKKRKPPRKQPLDAT